MNKVDRYKILIRHVINTGVAMSQKDFGKKLGYSNESSFSQIINGKVDEPKDFILKIARAVPELNADWIVSGAGTMLHCKSVNDDAMTVKDRIMEYCQAKNIKIGRFERDCKLSNGYLSKLRHEPSRDKIESILSVYLDLNPEWLMTGGGNMLRLPTVALKETTNYVLVLPIAAQGGRLNDFTTAVKEEDCERIISPIKGVDFAMSVSGDSMEPEYPSGSKIIVKSINARAFIEWGRVYVLDTCNGSVIKKIMPGSSVDCIMCQSINPSYPPFEVNISDIYGIYRVMMMLSEK